MGIFSDKEYEELDWISQAVEPIKSPMNDILGKLPDELVFDFKTYLSFRVDNYSVGLTTSEVILDLAGKLDIEVDYSDRDLLSSCFQFRAEDAEIDFENQEIRGVLKLVKIKTQLEEKELAKTLGRKGMYYMDRHLSYRNAADSAAGRLNDLIEVLDITNPARASRSIKNKMRAIKFLVRNVMDDNKWNLKDASLADKVGIWITKYVMDGNTGAYANVCKLKLMTHKGLPIYSISEERV